MTTTPGEPVDDLDVDATGITNESVAASEGADAAEPDTDTDNGTDTSAGA